MFESLLRAIPEQRAIAVILVNGSNEAKGCWIGL